MSIDEEIRGYERALLRAGKSPREIAAGLLGVEEPDRFLLVVMGPRAPGPSTIFASEDVAVGMPFGMARGQVSLPMARVRMLTITSGPAGWRNGWAAPMLTVAELDGWMGLFADRGFPCGVWDAREVRSRSSLGSLLILELHFGWSRPEVSDPEATGGGGDLMVPHVVDERRRCSICRRFSTFSASGVCLGCTGIPVSQP